MARGIEREGFDDATRVRLCESDLDHFDEAFHALHERLGKMLWSMIGILVSVTTAGLLLALDLVVRS